MTQAEPATDRPPVTSKARRRATDATRSCRQRDTGRLPRKMDERRGVREHLVQTCEIGADRGSVAMLPRDAGIPSVRAPLSIAEASGATSRMASADAIEAMAALIATADRSEARASQLASLDRLVVADERS